MPGLAGLSENLPQNRTYPAESDASNEEMKPTFSSTTWRRSTALKASAKPFVPGQAYGTASSSKSTKNGLSADFLAARLGACSISSTTSSAASSSFSESFPIERSPPHSPITKNSDVKATDITSPQRSSGSQAREAPKSPSLAYLRGTDIPSTVRNCHENSKNAPQLVILDLNGTLCARKSRTTAGSRNARPRPYLSSFLQYLCGSDEIDGSGRKRFAVMIWSSAREASVNAMCRAIGFLPKEPRNTTSKDASLLLAMWHRAALGLTPEEFNAKVPVIKDLNKVWKALHWPVDELRPGQQEVEKPVSPIIKESEDLLFSSYKQNSPSKRMYHWSQRDTILIDDSPDKAVLQPNNHLVIPEFQYLDSSESSEAEQKEDTSLLGVIAVLERLRSCSNVSAVMRRGVLANIEGESERTREERIEEGREVLRKYDIPISSVFNKDWPARVQKTRLSTPSSAIGDKEVDELTSATKLLSTEEGKETEEEKKRLSKGARQRRNKKAKKEATIAQSENGEYEIPRL